jgi:hypothetical protein
MWLVTDRIAHYSANALNSDRKHTRANYDRYSSLGSVFSGNKSPNSIKLLLINTIVLIDGTYVPMFG